MTTVLLLVLIVADGPGSTVLPFLKIGQGARAAAMGDAATAMVADPTAIYWNPGGLGTLRDYHLALSHHQWFGDTRDELVHVALPAANGAVGLAATFSGETGVEYWDEQNQPGDTFGVWNASLAVGYGFEPVDGYALGMTLRGFGQSLRTDWLWGGSADLGALVQPLPPLRFGIAVRNLGLGWTSGPELLPTELAAGAGWSVSHVNLGADVVIPFDNAVAFRAGAEWLPVRELALRFGYRSGPVDVGTLGLLGGLTAGFGLCLGRASFDYSLAPYGRLGLTHRIGLQLSAPRRGSGALALSVADEQTMSPLRASVVLSGLVNSELELPRTGSARLERLAGGKLVIRTSHAGYVPRVDTMLVLGDRKQTASITLRRLAYGGITGGIYGAVSRKPLAGSVTYRGSVLGGLSVDAASGTFALMSIPAGSYIITAEGPTPDYWPQTCTLVVIPDRIADHDFYLIRGEQTFVFEGVNFETGKADIPPASHGALGSAAAILKANPGVKVEIAGHTDPREISTERYPSNWELSRARAEAVRTWLIDRHGVNPERLTANGYADTQPLATNDTEAGMATNRRVEFRVTGR